MGPSRVDIELRLLDPTDPAFLAAIKRRLISRMDFELTQTYLLVYLRVHGADVTGLVELLEVAKPAWQTLEAEMQYAMYLVQYARRSV